MRFVCFIIFATIGMATIALALLAGPLSGYYADQAVIRDCRRRVDDLNKLHAQQKELLANADDPSVITRAAINNLNYMPADALSQKQGVLPAPWPELQRALERIDKPISTCQPTQLQCIIEILAKPAPYQPILLICGSGLVIVAMTCFNRRAVSAKST